MTSKAQAYTKQARADFDAYIASGEAEQFALQEIHRLQLLQMALEKTSKAFLYHAEPNARYSHNVVLSAVNRLRSQTIADAAGMNTTAFINMLNISKPIFLLIEATSPSIGYDGRTLTREESERTANVEYPWQITTKGQASWIAPISREFSVVTQLRTDRNSRIALRLLERLISVAESVL